MATVLDLKPNRDLLDPNFETYRLDTQSLDVVEGKLPARVSRRDLAPGKFGLCHVQLQLNHNALITDDFNLGVVFYFSEGETDLRDSEILNAAETNSSHGEPQIVLLICSVKDDENLRGRGPSCLDWLMLDAKSDKVKEKISLTVTWRHQILGKAVPRFTKFLSDGSQHATRVLICADCHYEALGDSDAEPASQDQAQENSDPALFSYIQDETEATVIFSLEAGVSKNDIKVIITSQKIQVIIKAKTVIDGTLHDSVDPGSSVWCIVDSKLEITLCKRIQGRWSRLFTNDLRGEEIFDPAYAASVHERLKHLTSSEQDTACGSSLTESDRGEICDEPPDEFHVEVFSGRGEGVKRVNFSDLTGREYIMQMHAMGGPLLVLRHDVDGFAWRFSIDKENSVEVEHVYVISAFGYVVASKRDRVLSASCLEAGHSALVDAKNNVFIYEHQTKESPKKKILREYVVPLRSGATHVIGGRMFEDSLVLLTAESLFMIALPTKVPATA
ncbi:nudC domain-containing protein 1 [Galendromus occidentalis]|uniref:NudC domain-containing protein 1 n=1 Tax=Galendromus occidentalis TaxID=34638 RepID=A0AAJ6QN41_9ACAR|nr:nudC domain-containing protein 1 [Galendromus occidentalis]